jgi:hypothetical protein
MSAQMSAQISSFGDENEVQFIPELIMTPCGRPSLDRASQGYHPKGEEYGWAWRSSETPFMLNPILTHMGRLWKGLKVNMGVCQGVATGHGLPKVSLGPAVPNPYKLCGPQGRPAAVFYPFGHPTPYAYEGEHPVAGRPTAPRRGRRHVERFAAETQLPVEVDSRSRRIVWAINSRSQSINGLRYPYALNRVLVMFRWGSDPKGKELMPLGTSYP